MVLSIRKTNPVVCAGLCSVFNQIIGFSGDEFYIAPAEAGFQSVWSEFNDVTQAANCFQVWTKQDVTGAEGTTSAE